MAVKPQYGTIPQKRGKPSRASAPLILKCMTIEELQFNEHNHNGLNSKKIPLNNIYNISGIDNGQLLMSDSNQAGKLKWSVPNYLGVGDNFDKTYFNFNIPFIISSNVPSGDFWTLVNLPAQGKLSWFEFEPSSDATSSIITTDSIFFAVSTGYLTFSNNKKVITEFVIITESTGSNEQMGWGLSNTTAPFLDYDDQTVDACCFTFNSADGKLYAHTANAGAGHTEVDTGYTRVNLNTAHLYRIELNQGVDIKFYIDGALVATITTNLPDGGVPIKWGAGSTGSTGACFPYLIGSPNFAVEI